MDVATITAIASGIAIVLRAVTELVKVLRSRRAARADDAEHQPAPV